MKQLDKKQLTYESLRNFHGDLERYRHPLNRQVLYTPGVQYLAEQGGAYWLVDAIASYHGTNIMDEAIAADRRVGWLHFWKLDVQEDQSATLTARADSPDEPFIEQRIEYTDFCLPAIDIWAGYDSQYWTLYLPSEH